MNKNDLNKLINDIKSCNNLEDKIKLIDENMDKYSYTFNNDVFALIPNDLTTIISSLDDPNEMMFFMDKYKNKLKELDYIIEENFGLVEEYNNVIYKSIVKKLYNDDDRIQFIENKIDNADIYGLYVLINSVENLDRKLQLVDKYKEKIGESYIGEIIINSNLTYQKSKQLLEKYENEGLIKKDKVYEFLLGNVNKNDDDIIDIFSNLENINFESFMVIDSLKKITDKSKKITLFSKILDKMPRFEIEELFYDILNMCNDEDKDEMIQLLFDCSNFLADYCIKNIIIELFKKFKLQTEDTVDLLSKLDNELANDYDLKDLFNITEGIKKVTDKKQKIILFKKIFDKLSGLEIEELFYDILKMCNEEDKDEMIQLLFDCSNFLTSYFIEKIIKELYKKFNLKKEVLTIVCKLENKLDNIDLQSLFNFIIPSFEYVNSIDLLDKNENILTSRILMNFFFILTGKYEETDDILEKYKKQLLPEHLRQLLFHQVKNYVIDLDKVIKKLQECDSISKLSENEIYDIVSISDEQTKIAILKNFGKVVSKDYIYNFINKCNYHYVEDLINLIYSNQELLYDDFKVLNSILECIIKFQKKSNLEGENLEKDLIKYQQLLSEILKNKLFKDNEKLSNSKQIIKKLFNLDNYANIYLKNYLISNPCENEEKLDCVINIISKVSTSNSTEIQHLTPNLVSLLMNKEKDEQDKIIDELENVFLRNNLPMMAKLYKVFDIMHPNFGEFNGFDYQSPNLKSKNNPLYKQIILFADLMRITVGSNNRSLKEYIKHIEIGNNIAYELIYNDIDISSLDDSYKEILINYLNHLETLYSNTLYGKSNPVKLSGNIKKDILMFISLFGKNENNFDIDKLTDRIVKMFGHFAGIDTMDELKQLMDMTIKNADQRNRERASLGKFEIHKGDFIKGIANQDKEDEFYSFLTNIFQNGSLCKELLGDAARSDTTPCDTDVSQMLEEPTSFEDAFTNPKYASSRYGPLWIVLKNDDRFNETNETNNKYIPGKLEVFETSMDGAGHYGIRTGFASSDIDYLVVDEFKIKMDRIKYEIVMNGFYIPLVNTKGNLVFTPDEYDKLHEKMAGLSYYGTEHEYKFASELDNFEIDNTGYKIDIYKSINEVTKVREEVINKLRETGLDIKLGRSLDLKDKCIDLIDTGSTSRGTNKMDGYDFDFVMRIDKEIYINDDKMNELYESFKKVFPDIKIDGHKIRKYKVKLSNGREIELDITFIMKTNKMDYSTEECLQDRLNTIKNMSEEKYKKVLENIVLAKYVLSSVYKSKNVAENPQGGLGGVGIENWILQNGGSFERAARDFLDKAEGKNFEEFSKVYTIWDFGQNNLSFKRDDGYTHDEFIKNNINEEGYNKMASVLKEYVNTLEHSKQL